MYSILCIFLVFIIYSIIGYLVEISSCSIWEKKIVFSRGYMIGPYIPIYGVGSLIISLLLDKYKNDIVVLFIMGMVLCILLEYFTSLFMEKIFKLRWWDYSDRKFNVDGRICLENGVLFGIGGVFVVKYLNPFMFDFVYSLPSLLVYILGIILFIIFMVDFIESTYIICHLKINIGKYINKDATMTIKREVIKSFQRNKTFTNRLLKAFPNLRETRNSKIDLKRVIHKIKKKSKGE